MKYVNSNLFKVQLLAQLAIVIIFYFLDISLQFQIIVAGILLCTVGIPHGANDYLYQKNKSIVGLIKFLAIYLITMLLYFILWWFMPLLALILFFLISFHHFGQSNFENKSFWYLPSLLWGIWILAFPVLLHFNEAVLIFNQMLEPNGFKQIIQLVPTNITNWQLALVGTFALLYILTLIIYEKLNLFPYLVQFFLISIWVATTPLIFGFILIFCVWHSLQSAQHQLNYYKITLKGSSLSFFKAIIPFSLMALLFIGVYIFFKGFHLNEAFILLSLISLPHVVVMHRLYGDNHN